MKSPYDFYATNEILSFKVHGLTRDSALVCLGCYGSLDDEEPFACPECGLPLCSEACQASPAHQPECLAFRSLGHEAGRNLTLCLINELPTLLDMILLLRCLNLRTVDDDHWFRLNQLQASSETEENLWDPDLEALAVYVIDKMLENFAHLELDKDLLTRLYGILTINAFEIPNAGEASLCSVYATGCLPEHNCVPTCHRSFGQDLSITLRSAVPLEATQRISITYTDSLWPTRDRRGHLAYSKNFQCDCNRCQDPTELGTYLSALKCMKCPVGHYLPTEPLDANCQWQCEDCATRAPGSFANEISERIGQSIKAMEENGLEPEICEKFVMVHAKMLHPQHAHMLDIKHSLLHLLGHHEGYLMADLSDKQLQIKEDTARCILKVADKIIPGKKIVCYISYHQMMLLLVPFEPKYVNYSSYSLSDKNCKLKKILQDAF